MKMLRFWYFMVGWNFLGMISAFGEGSLSRALFMLGLTLIAYVFGEVELEQLKQDKPD